MMVEKRKRRINPKLRSASLIKEPLGKLDSEVLEGPCVLGVLVCGVEAACLDVEGNKHKCICPHDYSVPTADLRCPDRKTVPVNQSKPINVIPPLPTNYPRENISSPVIQQASPFHGSLPVLAAITGSGLLLAVVFAFCFWKYWRFSRCNRNAKDSVPDPLSKRPIEDERYKENPQYSPCSTTELQVFFNVPVLPRDHITFMQEIGEGCFGKVYKGELKTENDVETVAIKVLKESATKEAQEEFNREVEIMSAFKHCNILSLLGVSMTDTSKSPWMVFEFMPFGDLTKVLRNNNRTFWMPSSTIPRLNKDSLLDIALQIANGMAYLAEQRFVHRDLACRNCLVGEGLTVKIADFGMSRDVYTSDYYKIGGSRLLPVRWMSPESILYGSFTFSSDIWSYGVVLWEIYSLGKQPYFGHSNEEVVRMINQGIILAQPEDCPPFIYEIMKSCWRIEPKERTSFSAILVILQKCSRSPQETASLPRPPAFPVTPQITVDTLDGENYLKPLPTEPREYLQTLPEPYSPN